jgi:rare lipoprotein A (peptidoglycan hydrolase)
MDGVKALAVLASVYYPGDGIVAKDNYQASSGERYDQSAPKCAALQWPLGTMLHLVHGRNNIDVTINDYGPYHKGRALDVDKALHLGGLGSGARRALSAVAEGAASRGGGSNSVRN